MADLEVLVATMNQTDLSKYNEMNIQTNAVFANQNEEFSYQERVIDKHKVRMLTTGERGVGINRNKALLLAQGEILLLADDDIVYANGYEGEILNAFEELKRADVIIFSIRYTKNGKLIEEIRNPVKRRRLFNVLRFGACAVAVRRESLIKANIWFSQLFGGGCLYGSGEDSLFLRDCIGKGLKIYSHSFVLGDCSKNASSWFEGYNEKFFYDKGAWLACAFPTAKWLMAVYMAVHLGRYSEMSDGAAFKLILQGIKGYKSLKGYSS